MCHTLRSVPCSTIVREVPLQQTGTNREPQPNTPQSGRTRILSPNGMSPPKPSPQGSGNPQEEETERVSSVHMLRLSI